jgi:hypothetical protein
MRKRYLFLIIAVLPLVIWQSLNQNNFCYAELKFLQPYEILDRFLFGENLDKLNMEEKIFSLAANPRGTLHYPNCCLINIGRHRHSWLERAVGSTFYAVTIISPPTEIRGDQAYYRVLYVNQCGKYSRDQYSATLSKEQYLSKRDRFDPVVMSERVRD